MNNKCHQAVQFFFSYLPCTTLNHVPKAVFRLLVLPVHPHFQNPAAQFGLHSSSSPLDSQIVNLPYPSNPFPFFSLSIPSPFPTDHVSKGHSPSASPLF